MTWRSPEHLPDGRRQAGDRHLKFHDERDNLRGPPRKRKGDSRETGASYHPPIMDCNLAGSTLHYETFGEGQPILMLHGWPLDHRQLVFEMERHFVARVGWKRIYVDLPGMGRSQVPELVTGSDQVLDVLEEFVDRVTGGSKFVIAGTSYGAYLALGLVHRCADRIDGLLMSVPGLLQDKNLPTFEKTHEDKQIVEAARSEGMTWPEEMAVNQNASLLEYARALQLVIPADERFLERLYPGRRFSFDASVMPEPFPGPTLILTGRQDSACGYYGAWRLLEHFPRATFAVLDGAGHLMWGEQLAVCSALVCEWLDRVEAWQQTSKHLRTT